MYSSYNKTRLVSHFGFVYGFSFIKPRLVTVHILRKWLGRDETGKQFMTHVDPIPIFISIFLNTIPKIENRISNSF